MKALFLSLLSIMQSCFALPYSPLPLPLTESISSPNFLEEIQTQTFRIPHSLATTSPSLASIRSMLDADPHLNPAVINKVMMTLKCVQNYRVAHNMILTIADYSLPSNEKRLWIFDLKEQKRLFYTYVSHGITSGELLTTSFSNKYNSKASSIGVYQTEKAYYGREGWSLKLIGLDRYFNDNASNRAIVMHGGWYVEEPFIKKYGRAGRSWGCPAVPHEQAQAIIHTIKDKSLFVVYYPSEQWFAQSKFLNCEKITHTTSLSHQEAKLPSAPIETIMFADLNHNNRHEEQEPIITISAAHYKRIFSKEIPLTRMLRRPMDGQEYLALSPEEFNSMIARQDYDHLTFIVPEIKKDHGYFITVMKKINLGKIDTINAFPSPFSAENYSMLINNKKAIPIHFEHQFIRWLGL